MNLELICTQMKFENDHLKLIALYAALCHDLGKVGTTEVQKDGSVTSLGHAEEGYHLARRMLKRITHNKDLIDTVCKLVKYHMAPIQFIDNEAGKSLQNEDFRWLAGLIECNTSHRAEFKASWI